MTETFLFRKGIKCPVRKGHAEGGHSGKNRIFGSLGVCG